MAGLKDSIGRGGEDNRMNEWGRGKDKSEWESGSKVWHQMMSGSE